MSTPQDSQAPVPSGGGNPLADIAPYDRASAGVYPDHTEPASGARTRGLSVTAVLRFRRTFLGVFLVLATLGTLVSWTVVERKYEATATLEVSPTRERILYRLDNDGRDRFFQQYLRNTVGIIQSPTILERVVRRDDIRRTRWYTEPPKPLVGGPPSDVERLSEAVAVSVRQGMFLIDITASARSPREAVTIANAVHDEFLAYVREQSEQDSGVVFQKLSPEEQSLRDSIEDRNRRKAETLRELRATSPEQLVETRGAALDELLTERQALQRDIEVLKWQLERIRGTSPDDEDALTEPAVTAAGQQARYQQDARWSSLRAALDAAQQELKNAETQYGPAHPELERLRNVAQGHEQNLRERERYLDEQSNYHILQPLAGPASDSPQEMDAESIARQVKLKERRLESLSSEIKAAEQKFNDDFDRALRLERESEELQWAKDKYGRIRQRLDEVQLESAFGAVRSVARASPASRPAHWKRPYRFSAVAVFAGLVAGFFVASWRAWRTPEAHEFSRLVGAPILGLLPPAPGPRRQTGMLDSIEHESVRIVRTAILRRLQDLAGHTVLITSAGPGAGKTTLAMLLAKSLALAGKTVLLVDADLRRPRLAELAGIEAQHDILDVLAGRATDAEAIIPSNVRGLSLLPARHAAKPEDLELLSNGSIEACLGHWRERYDVVLLDSCPILPVADARILIRHADGIVLVAREGRCRQVDLSETVACLEECGGTLLGMVFVESHGHQAYRSMYKDYYGRYPH